MDHYLLDTDVLSDAISDPNGRIATRIARLGRIAVCTSIIVAAELRFGAVKRRSRRLAARVAEILATIDIVAFEAPADTAYADLRNQLERAGRPIGANDMLIAAQALAIGAIVATGNEREFSRVEGLRVENWLR